MSGNSPFEPPFEIEPLTPKFGAEIRGVNLAEPLSEELVAAIRREAVRWKVLFFRNQPMAPAQHVALGRCFGDLEVNPDAPAREGYPEIVSLRHHPGNPPTENVWHTDAPYKLPPAFAILRCLECPPVGGDTLFADMGAAFAGLPEDVKKKIEKAHALYDPRLPYVKHLREKGASEDQIADYCRRLTPVTRPLVPRHPESGERVLLMANRDYMQSIVGVEPEESEALIDFLNAQTLIPEYQCRFRWAKNSVVLWDERSTQHYAVADYMPHVRHVERVTIVGELPAI